MTSSIIYEGNLRTIATHTQSGTVIETDAPTDNQGKGERFSPTDLVATAVGNCMLTIMGIKAKEMNVLLDGSSVEITKIMTTDPRRISEIKVIFNFPTKLNADERQKMILEKVALTCPVVESIHPAIKLNIHFNWPQV